MTQLATARWPGIAHTPRTPLKARAAKAILRPTVNRVPVRLTFADGTHLGRRRRGRSTDAGRPTQGVLRPARRREQDRLRRGVHGRRLDHRTDGTDLADLLTPFAERMATIVPVPLQQFRVFVDKKLPIAPAQLRRGRQEEHRGPLRPLQRPVRRVPRSVDELLGRLVREPRAGPATTRRCTRSTASWTRPASPPAPACWRSAAAGVRSRSGRRSAARRSPRSPSPPSRRHWPQKRFAEAGVDVDLQLVDYRDVTGEYDAIVSVEMIEAVGEEYWPTYFAAIDKLLAPGGTVSIQAITMAHHRYLADPQLLRVDPEVHLPGRPDPLARGHRHHLGRSHDARGDVAPLPRPGLRADPAPLARTPSTRTGTRSGSRASTRRSTACGSSISRTARPASAPDISTSSSSR